MPRYDFIDLETDEIVERSMPMAEVPRIGEVRVFDGRQLQRVPSDSQVDVGVGQRVHGYPYASHSLPRGLAGAGQTKSGKPIVRSRAHERELMAQHNLIRD